MANNGVWFTYACRQYLEECVRMLQHCSNYLDQFRGGDESARSIEDCNVVTVDIGRRGARGR